jgi:NAD(P)-dependent dehydrogenase (short-subunit alcohol dehydrogenase family)
VETVLITGARAPVALEIARSFHAQNHRVILADSLHLPVSRWSNAVDRYYTLPSPRRHTDRFVTALQQIIAAENVTHLVPTCEEAFYISLFKDRFACKVWCVELRLMNQLHNKFAFTQLAAPFFPTPKTCLLTQFAAWKDSATYVFKPVYSRFASRVIINRPLAETYFAESEKPHWIVQKRITGKEICIYSIWDAGQLKAYAAYHPRFRVGKGAGIFFEPVAHPVAYEKVKTFGQTISYTGQLCFDVIVDEADTPYFIECNPRGTSGAHLLNHQLSAAFLDANAFELTGDATHSLKYALAVLKPWVFAQKQVRQSRDVIFRWRDAWPFVLQPLSLLEITYRMLAQRVSWLQATTGDIEWNGYEN